MKMKLFGGKKQTTHQMRIQEERKYDAKGMVKKVSALTVGDKYVTSIAAAVARVEADEKTVIVDVAEFTNKYSLIGNTLFDLTNNELGSGLWASWLLTMSRSS